MHDPQEVIGKTALYFEKQKVPYSMRVMVTKHLSDDRYIVSDFKNPELFYETTAWYFTIEKDADQPENNNLDLYLSKVSGA